LTESVSIQLLGVLHFAGTLGNSSAFEQGERFAQLLSHRATLDFDQTAE